jgi:hypothetical protein
LGGQNNCCFDHRRAWCVGDLPRDRTRRNRIQSWAGLFALDGCTSVPPGFSAFPRSELPFRNTTDKQCPRRSNDTSKDNLHALSIPTDPPYSVCPSANSHRTRTDPLKPVFFRFRPSYVDSQPELTPVESADPCKVWEADKMSPNPLAPKPFSTAPPAQALNVQLEATISISECKSPGVNFNIQSKSIRQPAVYFLYGRRTQTRWLSPDR